MAASPPEQNDAVREIRINPIVPTQSVLIATARGMRPKQAEQAAPRDTRKHVETCPFCSGNEHMTPPEIATYPSQKNWEIRIVENLYPVLGDDRTNPNFSFGLQQTIDGYGRHEVIIDHNHHGIGLHEMSIEHLAMLFGAYRDRMLELYATDDRLRYVLAFKNFGPAAGGSIPHTHSQVIAMPVVPDNVQAEVDSSQQFFDKNHCCIFCSLIDEALTFEATIYDRESGEVRRKLDVGQYVIERTEHFIAIKPFASRYEWEVHILPLKHQADYRSINADELVDLGNIVKHTMSRLEAVLGGVQYNYFIHSLPPHNKESGGLASFHWHVEICPRTSIPTGFELGAGLSVNTISPEEAAIKLRDVSLEN